ncbi:MAG: 3-deoxy-D-manno-octulosonic acid transferase [Paracoccus denitrificans]|nr:MAG: 3-deoxy-D-manno-octulosonic acid transferase [Paracoccus denitrificans]PZO84893.1 MAG: 3-deoxy-D-manno-octulosonic acid transferase [Paracoccus denitrificans]
MSIASGLYRGATGLGGALLRAGAPAAGPVWRERLALELPPLATDGVWIHAASVGEVTSVQMLARDLSYAMPVQFTTNTTSGVARARDLGFSACLAPLDVPGAVSRFLDALNPQLALTVENEIWPNRAAALRARGVPQVVVGARLSARSAKGWLRARGLIEPVLAGLAGLSAQDQGSEARFLSLGLPPDALLPRVQLKLSVPAQVVPPPDSAARDRTWLAASTHEGEEDLILDAFLAAKARVPDLRLILAPRHPKRGDSVAASIAVHGLPLRRRSQGADEPDPVLLVDVLGEMPRWYDAAGICLTGGSFVDVGGHTPWEPAAHRCAILHGPDVANSAEGYAALAANGATLQVTPTDLADAVVSLATDPARARRMGQAARQVLDTQAGDLSPLLGAVLALAKPSA